VVTVIDSDTFTIPKATVSGSGVGSFISPNLIIVGGNSSVTAATISSSINQEGTYVASVSGSDITLVYTNLSTTFSSTNVNGFITNSALQGIRFDSVPSSDYNSETGITEPLFLENSLVDIIQKEAGHQIRGFDILIPSGGLISNTDIYFNYSQIPDELVVGDYMCLANECIIPQIPSDLHTALTEKAAARILSAIGDVEGLGTLTMKMAETSKAQAHLIDNRVEGAPIKINTNHTMLRFQKWTYRRRF
jgi:hypothetical protein